MKKNAILLVLLLILILGSVGVYAHLQKNNRPIVIDSDALLPQLTKEELIRQSDVIVTGYVDRMESFQAPSEIRPGEKDVKTDATIDVEKYLRNYSGNSSNKITVQALGGTAGNLTMNVAEAPVFKEGEHVLVFLKKQSPDVFSVYGWAQGKYSLDGKGNVAIGDQELSYFRNVFGTNLTLSQVEEEIAKYKDVAPEPEIPAMNYGDDTTMTPNEKNAEANSVLNN